MGLKKSLDIEVESFLLSQGSGLDKSKLISFVTDLYTATGEQPQLYLDSANSLSVGSMLHILGIESVNRILNKVTAKEILKFEKIAYELCSDYKNYSGCVTKDEILVMYSDLIVALKGKVKKEYNFPHLISGKAINTKGLGNKFLLGVAKNTDNEEIINKLKISILKEVITLGKGINDSICSSLFKLNVSKSKIEELFYVEKYFPKPSYTTKNYFVSDYGISSFIEALAEFELLRVQCDFEKLISEVSINYSKRSWNSLAYDFSHCFIMLVEDVGLTKAIALLREYEKFFIKKEKYKFQVMTELSSIPETFYFQHNIDYTEVVYKGSTFRFNTKMADIVRELHQSYPESRNQRVLLANDYDSSRLKSVFGKHPSWKANLFTGDKSGNFTLNI